MSIKKTNMEDTGGVNYNFSNNSADSQDVQTSNQFTNDGSFMELFKKKMLDQNIKECEKERNIQEENSKSTDTNSVSNSKIKNTSCTLESKPVQQNSYTNNDKCKDTSKVQKTDSKPAASSLTKKYGFPIVGKRRGGAPALKTGAVKKKKIEPENPGTKSDPWAQYMAEVNKYKSQSCQDEDKTRPLVK